MTAERGIIGRCLRVVLRYHHPVSILSVMAITASGLGSGDLLAASPACHQAAAADSVAQSSTSETQPVVAHRAKRANFERARASQEARHVADWVVDSGDNRALPFAIVDKKDARVFVFSVDGLLLGAAPALLGLALGDDSAPGMGDRALSNIRPEERTTPAGRFKAALGLNSHGKEVLWVDYDDAVSMHPVVTGSPKERRAQRLATPTPLDNRISYGCINVPVEFYVDVVHPAFTGTYVIVYVLPETKSAREVFGSYDVEER